MVLFKWNYNHVNIVQAAHRAAFVLRVKEPYYNVVSAIPSPGQTIMYVPLLKKFSENPNFG